MSNVFCPLRAQKLSKKQRKRIFVYCSKMPYFRDFLHISTSHEKCAEIFNSRTGHLLLYSQTVKFQRFASFSFPLKWGHGTYMGLILSSHKLARPAAGDVGRLVVIFITITCACRRRRSGCRIRCRLSERECIRYCVAGSHLVLTEHMTVQI